MKNWDWRAATAGAAAGLANGFFGAGGGMLLVPLLAGWCRLPGKTCFTTALAEACLFFRAEPPDGRAHYGRLHAGAVY